jgi:hypothetical protein
VKAPLDPYAPPQADVAPIPAPAAVGVRVRLYSPTQVGVASLLGSAVAGGILIGLNERALGNPSPFLKPLFVSGGIVLAVLLIGQLLPESFPTFVFGLAQFFAMKAYVDATQAATFREHVEAGGLRGSNWKVLAAVLGASVVVLSFSLALVFIIDGGF